MTTETDSGDRRRGGVAADRIRILIVDDHALFRVGIANILRALFKHFNDVLRNPDLQYVPFTFAGVMNGFLEHPLTRPSDALPIFTVELGGSGRASARFFGLVDDNGARVYSVFPDSIRYDFTTSEPVPEPWTLLLVGGALGGLILVRAGSRGGRRGRSAHV